MVINEQELYNPKLFGKGRHTYMLQIAIESWKLLVYCTHSFYLSHLFSVYSLVDHVPEGAPVSVQPSAVLGVRLTKGQKVIGGVDPGGQTMVVDLTEKTCNVV